MDDAIVIDWMPLATIYNAVAESVESFVTNIIPTHLRDTLRLLGLLVHEGFQQFIFLLPLKEAEVAFAFYLVFETVELSDIHLA